MKVKSKTIYHPAFIFHTALQFYKWQFSQPACVFMFPNSISKCGCRAIDHAPLSHPPAEPEAKQQKTQQEFLWINRVVIGASQLVLVVKNLPANAGDIRDVGLIPESGRSPGGAHGHRLQYSCLENPMDRGAWWAAVRRVTKSQTGLKWT